MSENEIGKKIRKERLSQNLGQEELSLKAEISKQYLEDVETGKTFPSLKVLSKISKALDLSCALFLK